VTLADSQIGGLADYDIPNLPIFQSGNLPIRVFAAAATPAAATAAVVVAAAAAAATVEPAATAAEPAAAGRLRLGFIHDDGAAVHLVLVQLLDGLGRRFVCGHFHEAKTPRAPGRHVPHDSGTGDIANGAEQRGQFFIRSFVGKVSDVQPATHD
jgi:hypothetical protein